MLSAFTTKLAIFMLATCFAGFTPLIYIGAIMAVVTSFYAFIENDLRRALAYSLNGQLGLMVIGIGIGSALALNGAVAHAFASTLYQGLLFMAMGAVLHRTGTAKADALGGEQIHAAHRAVCRHWRRLYCQRATIFRLCHQIADAGRSQSGP